MSDRELRGLEREAAAGVQGAGVLLLEAMERLGRDVGRVFPIVMTDTGEHTHLTSQAGSSGFLNRLLCGVAYEQIDTKPKLSPAEPTCRLCRRTFVFDVLAHKGIPVGEMDQIPARWQRLPGNGCYMVIDRLKAKPVSAWAHVVWASSRGAAWATELVEQDRSEAVGSLSETEADRHRQAHAVQAST